jgi:tripartite ATP-independent transporter DctP family solute receptor
MQTIARCLARWLSATAVLAFASVALAQGAGQPVVMRIAHAMPATHGYHLWALKFRDELKKSVGDRVDVKVFPNAQLGKEPEYLEGMKLGTIDGSIFGRHGVVDARLEVLNLPMIYRDDAHVDAVLRKGNPVQAQLEQIMYDRGYKVLGWGELGFRYITTKATPIRKASDLKGIDIRVPSVDPWLIAFRAWGANPTPIDFSELYSALQQGVVKAQENPPEIIFSSKIYEVQKFLSLTGHANIPCEFVLGRAYWEKLPKDLQDAIMKAATVSRDEQVRLAREANINLLGELEKKGMTIVRDVDKASFEPGAREAYAKFEDKIGKDLIKAVKDAK